MSFDIDTLSGMRWNARMLSSGKDECELFLMDSVTLMPILFAKLRAISSQTEAVSGFSRVSADFTFFDFLAFLGVMAASFRVKLCAGAMANGNLFTKRDIALHKKYMRMVLDSGFPRTPTNKNRTQKQGSKSNVL